MSKKFSDFWPKNFRKLSKLTSVCADEQFVAWSFFQNFWTVLNFLQKPSAWCSNFYLRVQSENSGRNNFFNLLFIIFSDFERIFFRLLAIKLQMFVKTTFCVSRGTICGFKNFKKNFESFWIFCRNLWHGSQIFISVSRVKIAEELVFFCFSFQNFFEFCAKNFQTFGQKSSRSCQNYLLRVQTNNFWLEETFKSFEPFLDFLQKPLAWFSKFYLRVQSKNSGRNKFFILLFRIFSDFERNFFRFLAKKLQEVIKTTFYVSRRTVCGLNFFLNHEPFWILCRNLWHVSQNSI